MSISQQSFKLLVAAHLPGIGPATLLALARHPELPNLPLEELGGISARVHKVLTANALSAAHDEATRQAEEALRVGGSIMTVLDSDYPAVLQSVPDAPAVLYVKGERALLSGRMAAVIGTRSPTSTGLESARRLAVALSTANWCVVSGLAMGCDAAAHSGALEAFGGTVAVLAHGMHTVAPARNSELAARILAEGGALVSEYGWGVDVAPFRFAARDRIQAALSVGVFLVQSPLDGGSLIACRAAIRYKRLLCVVAPTASDRLGRQPALAANVVLLEGAPHAQCELLKCDPKSLTNICPVNSKADYPELLHRMTLQYSGLTAIGGASAVTNGIHI
jgi:DNA processing protein